MPLVVSIEAMRVEVLRELGFRGRVYPRWVTQGKLRPEKSAEQLERMQAILEALEELRLARAFQAAMVRSCMPIDLLGADQPTNDAISAAWVAWCAPRAAPLTTGTHAKGPG